MECCWGKRAEHEFSGGGTLDAAYLGVIGWDGETAPWLPSVCSFKQRGGKENRFRTSCAKFLQG